MGRHFGLKLRIGTFKGRKSYLLFYLPNTTDSKVRAAKDHGKKFQSRSAASFSGIVYSSFFSVHMGVSLFFSIHVLSYGTGRPPRNSDIRYVDPKCCQSGQILVSISTYLIKFLRFLSRFLAASVLSILFYLLACSECTYVVEIKILGSTLS